jgi:hypothetical protein
VSEAKRDLRHSIEERYLSYKDYVNRVKAAARKLGLEGVLLGEDEDAIVERAKKMVWPPVPTEPYPFWKMRAEPGK